MPNCPVCQTSVEAPSERYVSPYNQQEYKRYSCPNCDLHWWEPLKIIPEFYESEYLTPYREFHEGSRNKIPAYSAPFFKLFPKHIKGRLLDVGCGDGIFLKEAQRQGFEVWGIDFDRKSVETARKKVGVDTIYAMSLEEFYQFAKEKNIKFDVITFFEVLEHQDKPMEFLRMVRGLLKNGGYIAGSVPNRNSIIMKLYSKLYPGDFPPHHFLRFSQKALEETLKRVGFDSEVHPSVRNFSLLIPHTEAITLKLFGIDIEKAHKPILRTISKTSKPGLGSLLYRMLRLTRDVAFTIPTIPLWLIEEGLNLYFQGRKV
ncbi:class I SAM-dependent methyltransferase [Thermocrinis minervae]|uniref:Methyltransferase domain-containing protein n=1 Tax=Thermocrinis minervae TaxID=381751 RepID=A0A1M6SA50_9AQUI|nr:class I SAM-dependent methyltransferase [Thermocrinis minervae]SHK41418.1 Methyltransferase domain-containing protein [Thermocrinis minervae]